jgi:hypothetical protein
MKTFTYSLIGLAGALAFTACSPDNPKLMPPPEVNHVMEINPGSLETEAESKVDILFVIDDSQSMAVHQQNVSRNIQNFVKAFEKNSLIDIHVGVTTCFDSRIKSYVDTHPRLAGRKITVTPLGQLLTPANSTSGPRYITRDTPDYLKVLEQTLLVGAKPGPDQDSPELGPMFEEFFSPVRAVLSEPAVNGVNAGFYRPDAVLVVFFITDANDESPSESADSLYKFLVALKGGDASRVQSYAAIIPSGVQCKRDSSGAPKKIEEFLDLFQNRSHRTLNLCSQDFGTKLAQFGRDITEVIPEKIITFPSYPEAGSIHVYYGSQELQTPGQYLYIPHTEGTADPDRLKILRNLDLKYEKGAHFRVDFVPVRPENVVNGRTRKI